MKKLLKRLNALRYQYIGITSSEHQKVHDYYLNKLAEGRRAHSKLFYELFIEWIEHRRLRALFTTLPDLVKDIEARKRPSILVRRAGRSVMEYVVTEEQLNRLKALYTDK